MSYRISVHNAPHQGPTLIDHLVGQMSMQVDTYTDGTTTEVFIIDPEDATKALGRGVARRRKGDPRDVQVGHELALARALRDMADDIEKAVQH